MKCSKVWILQIVECHCVRVDLSTVERILELPSRAEKNKLGGKRSDKLCSHGYVFILLNFLQQRF